MTQDEIIKMAREAGFSAKHTEAYFDRQIVALFHAAYAAGAAAEREACAKVCDTYTAWGLEWQKDSNHMAAEAATNECAAAIRARGAK